MLSGVGDALVQLGDFRFRFLPVIRNLLLACQPPLQLLELGQELLEWRQPVYGSAFRRRDELGYPPVDPHHCRGGVSWWLDLPQCVNADVELASRLADGDAAYLAENFTAVAVAYPTNLWQLDAVVPLLQLDALLVRFSKRISHSFLVKLRELGSLLEEIRVGPIEVENRLL